jgi:hypothetical protein
MIELVKREMDDISYRSVTPIRPIDYHPQLRYTNTSSSGTLITVFTTRTALINRIRVSFRPLSQSQESRY